MEEESERKVVPASEILAKIERGEPVVYDSVVVEGDLDIDKLDLPPAEHVVRTEAEKDFGLSDNLKVISSPITITDSEIRGTVNFGNALFQGTVSFQRAQFIRFAYFGGAQFTGDTRFEGTQFSGDANFWRAQFSRFADFCGTTFSGVAGFARATFSEVAYFGGTTFSGVANFVEATFSVVANFVIATFSGVADFSETTFSGVAYFGGTTFSEAAYFGTATFSGVANFGRATFSKDGHFDHDQFSKGVSFEDTKFSDPWSQEIACRIAKRKMEEQGNKEVADDYFFREIEAIRIQNGIRGIERETYPTPADIRERLSQLRDKINLLPSKIKRFLIYDVLEYVFIQRVFGYGVRPFNIAKAWLIVVFTLGVVYWTGAGVVKGNCNNPLEWYEYFYFSIVTAATPGYAGYTPASGLYTLIAGAQAIFGTFMWAAFIATFARKWQR